MNKSGTQDKINMYKEQSESYALPQDMYPCVREDKNDYARPEEMYPSLTDARPI